MLLIFLKFFHFRVGKLIIKMNVKLSQNELLILKNMKKRDAKVEVVLTNLLSKINAKNICSDNKQIVLIKISLNSVNSFLLSIRFQ